MKAQAYGTSGSESISIEPEPFFSIITPALASFFAEAAAAAQGRGVKTAAAGGSDDGS